MFHAGTHTISRQTRREAVFIMMLPLGCKCERANSTCIIMQHWLMRAYPCYGHGDVVNRAANLGTGMEQDVQQLDTVVTCFRIAFASSSSCGMQRSLAHADSCLLQPDAVHNHSALQVERPS